MAKSLLDLAARLDRIADGLDDDLKGAKTAVAGAVVRYLLDHTPVDTTEALSNWRASRGTALTGAIPPLVAGKGGSTRSASLSAALAAAMTVIEAASGQELLVIFNNVPYIQRLNDGYSAQAPAGWVEQAVLVGRSTARNYKIRIAK